MAFFDRLFGTRGDDDILVAIELHSVEQIRAVLDGGLNPRSAIRGKSLHDRATNADTSESCPAYR